MKTYLLPVIIFSLVTVITFQLYQNKKDIDEVAPIDTLAQGATACIEENHDHYTQGKCFYRLAERVYDLYEPSVYDHYFQEGVDRQILNNCHEFMHYVGWRTYNNSTDMADAFSKAVPVCNQGMYHGIVEEYIKNLNYDTELAIPKLLSEGCQEVAKQTETGIRHRIDLCFHGVGHGLMFITNKDLPRSLDLCDGLPIEHSLSCYTGVYMENQSSKAVGDVVDHPSDYYNPDDVNYPCQILKPNQKEYCYFYEAVDLLNIHQNDSAAWFKACQDFPEEYRDVCYSGIGTNIPSPSLPARETEPMCKAALSYGLNAYEKCLTGVLNSASSHFNGDPQALADICDETEVEAKTFCYQKMGLILKDWVKPEENLESLCQALVDDTAINICSNPQS